MAILSVSRRTDIPTFYSEWFIRRLEEGYLLVRNPYDKNQVSKIPLNKDTVDCIVFWTKNPIPMMTKLDRIKYPFYFQYTLTGYGRDIEPNLPDKNMLIECFQDLSIRTGGRVIWRYDPIVFNHKYTFERHIESFAYIASKLKGYTKRCVISFVDNYDCNKDALRAEREYKLSPERLEEFCKTLVEIARKHDMEIVTCAEVVDLDKVGIKHGRCIDPDYIEEILGKPIKGKKDGSQREACGCMESVEVGAYNTCFNGCKYCYACRNAQELNMNSQKYKNIDIINDSPMLCDVLYGWERVTERKLSSVIDYKALEQRDQLSLFTP